MSEAGKENIDCLAYFKNVIKEENVIPLVSVVWGLIMPQEIQHNVDKKLFRGKLWNCSD